MQQDYSVESQEFEAGNGSDELDPRRQFTAYPFAEDEAFQQGLSSILAGEEIATKSKAEKEAVVLRSQIFYFNRVTGSSITLESLAEYLSSTRGAEVQNPAPPSLPAREDELRVLSFAELKDMIESGNTDQIPNNRPIPDVLNDTPPSESKAPSRKKPWETAA
ncbi:hypothetical protein PLICRDRAFT_104505 [Plicaturopsis crispa FD-325 SS-3]|nr:hypothetical protein PLICRDRAFT_104505 [Plicaturopsis crispa FD-325 SS-3]